MGKLAVPEYILNKPGRLTPAEFEKMKLHASVGADILSAIHFPYPVVPIVRHHHENWDGTGYPDHLRGTDIPIGARILSVVDCFDALTSDRPYRPKISDKKAISILLERRDSMYDPLVVDTFVKAYSELAPEERRTSTDGRHPSALTPDVTCQREESQELDAPLNDILAATEEAQLVYELAQALTADRTVADVCDLTATRLRRVVPTATSVFFIYHADTDELVSHHATGDNASALLGLRIPRGQRLTGWVAANQQSIVNSDPILDLGELARVISPTLRSCMRLATSVGR
jgi:hypothetical protein